MGSKKKADSAEREALLHYMHGFIRLERRYPLMPGASSPETHAMLMGVEPEAYLQVAETQLENVRKTAIELLEDEDVQDWLQRLPFKKGDLILAFGDSSVSDRQGWFQILRHVLDIGLPDSDLEFVESGMSWETTGSSLLRIQRDLLDREPDWVVLSTGAFDALRLHALPDRTLTPISETWENLNALESVVKSVTGNPPIWLVPHPVMEQMQEDAGLYEYVVRNQDLRLVQQLVAGKTGYIVDPLAHRFGRAPEAWYFLSDGLHASLSGHAVTVREILWSLARQDGKTGSSQEAPVEE